MQVLNLHVIYTSLKLFLRENHKPSSRIADASLYTIVKTRDRAKHMIRAIAMSNAPTWCAKSRRWRYRAGAIVHC